MPTTVLGLRTRGSTHLRTLSTLHSGLRAQAPWSIALAVMSHSASLESIGNRRSACDRCRRHKLRFERGDTARCRRCEKANAHCATGHALQSGRPVQLSHSPRQSAYQSLNSGSDSNPTISDVMMLPLPSETNPEVPAYGPQPNTDRFISPANLDDFNDIWSQNFDKQFAIEGIAEYTTPLTPPPEQRNVFLKKFADLQANVLVDLEMVKHCITPEKCGQATAPTGSITSQNVLIGRMLDHSTALIEILNFFRPASSDAFCDSPMISMLASCFVSLTRIYRTILSCVLDSLPYLLGIRDPTPQLFPGMHLGGFKLEARVDLQVQILVQVSEGMLSKIEAGFGLCKDASSSAPNNEGKAARLLRMMLEEEASEQPVLYEPRGHCKPLKEILRALQSTRTTNPA